MNGVGTRPTCWRKALRRGPCDHVVLGSRARDPPFPASGSRCQKKADRQDSAKDPPALADIDAIRARELADRHIVENR